MQSPTEDAFLRLFGFALAATGVVVLALPAAVSGLFWWGVSTWRRWRWWPLTAAGATLLAGVVVISGPQGALARHLVAFRELTSPLAPGLSLIALAQERLGAWTLAQVPLGLPAGILAAALLRYRTAHVPAHELASGAKRRQEDETAASRRRAMGLAQRAPLDRGGRPVLGAFAGGDLGAWRSGRYAVVPDGALCLGTVVVGLPGSGKTETLLRLAALALSSGYDVHVLDAKGEAGTQARFAALAEVLGAPARLFPASPYDGFRGEARALRNRFERVVDYSEPYYHDGARVLLASAMGTPSGPPRSLPELLSALSQAKADIEAGVRRGTISRYQSFSAAVGGDLDPSGFAFEDTRASYLLLDGVALGEDSARLARFLVEDFAHYACARKDPTRRALLLIDEFSALRLPNAAALLERLRSFGAGVVVAAQSVEGLHEDPSERARLLNAATTVIAHRLADPEEIAKRAGTRPRLERSHQLDAFGPTGAGSLRLQDSFRLDPNELRALVPGMAVVVSGGRVARVAISRAPVTSPLALTPREPSQPGGVGEAEPPEDVVVAQGDVALSPYAEGL